MTLLDPLFQTNKTVLAARLKAILPAHCLLIDEEDLKKRDPKMT